VEEEKLKTIIAKIVEVGPSRVVINAEGEATTPERALHDYGVKPAVIYIRNDTWSLGAPRKYDAVAQSMWKDEWIAVVWLHDFRGWVWRRWGNNDIKEV